MARPALTLSPQKCDKCMRCLRECPLRAIQVGASFVFVDWDRCDGCGKCVSVCDAGALGRRAGAPVAPPKPAPRLHSVTDADASAAPADGRVRGPRLDDIAPLAPTWHAWEVAVVLAGVLALFAVEQAALGSQWMVRVVPMGAKPLMRSGILALFYAAQLGLLATLGYRKGVGFGEAFGLRRFAVVPTALALVALVTATRVFTLAYAVIVEMAGWTRPLGPMTDIMQYFGRDGLGLVLTVVMIVIVGPFFEEIVFRGVLLGYLQERVGAWPAVVTAALVFAGFHMNAWEFAQVAVLGVACGWLAVRSRSVWAAYALHMLYNAVPVFLVFFLPK